MEYSPTSPRYNSDSKCYSPSSPRYSPSNSPRYGQSYSPRWSPQLPASPQSPHNSSSVLCYSPTQSSSSLYQDRLSPPLPPRSSSSIRSAVNTFCSSRNNFNNNSYRRSGGKFRGNNNSRSNTYTKQHYSQQQKRQELPTNQRPNSRVYREIKQLLMERDFSYERTIRLFAKQFSSSFTNDSSSSSSNTSDKEIPQTSVSLIGRSGSTGVQCLVPVYNVCYENIADDQEPTNKTHLQLMRPQLLYNIRIDVEPRRTICVRLIQLDLDERNYSTGAKQLFSGTMEELTKRFTREHPLPLFGTSKLPELILSMDVDVSTIPHCSLMYSVGVAFSQNKFDQWRRQQFIIGHVDPMDQSCITTLQ